MKYRLPFFSLLVTVATILGMSEKTNIAVIVSLPHHLIPALETLAGASIAVEEINTNSGILSEHNLQMIVVDGVKDNDILQEFINLTYYQSSKQVVAVCGFLSPKIVSILSPLARQRDVLITTPAQSFVTVSEDIVALYSPHAIATALLHFVHRMDWNRVGLSNLVISPYVETLHLDSAIQEIVTQSSRIIIVSLNVEKAVQLLCVISSKGLVWPDYAWIFHNYNIEYILFQPANCNLEEAINGIFVIESQLPPELSEDDSIRYDRSLLIDKVSLQFLSTLSLEYNTTFNPNPLAIIMYELIWQTAIALNNTCHHSSGCRTHQVDPLVPYVGSDVWSMNVFHVRGQSWLFIGTMYGNSSTTSVSLNESIVDTVALNELTVVSVDDPPLGYTIVVALIIALLATYVTIMLILYILLRKQPEIKATSFSLSLLMFSGCYLILLYSSLINFYNCPAFNSLSTSSQNTICLAIQWTSPTGVSLPLALAVLLIKLIRIYYIFNKAKTRIGQGCSDLVLVSYVLMILSPTLLVNLIWNFTDRYHTVLKYSIQYGFVYVEKGLESKYSAYWLGILSVYLIILLMTLTVVAVMTRKVRLQHFKDTKKVNILVFILCCGIILTYSYWLLLKTLKSPQYFISTVRYIAMLVLIISFQSLLFLPKVFPPLLQKYHAKDVST